MVLHQLGNNHLAEKVLRDAVNADPTSYVSWYTFFKLFTHHIIALFAMAYLSGGKCPHFRSKMSLEVYLWGQTFYFLVPPPHPRQMLAKDSLVSALADTSKKKTGSTPYSNTSSQCFDFFFPSRQNLGRVLQVLEDFEAAAECLNTAVGLEATSPVTPFTVIPKSLQVWRHELLVWRDYFWPNYAAFFVVSAICRGPSFLSRCRLYMYV